MRKETVWTVVLCGLALTGTALAKDVAANNGAGPVDFFATVVATRTAPATDALPGLHIDAKVNGRVQEIYIAPMPFVKRYEVKIAKGDTIRVVGNRVIEGESDVVLAREVTCGTFGKNDGLFRPTETVYLRNDAGPFWEDNKSIPDAISAH